MRLVAAMFELTREDWTLDLVGYVILCFTLHGGIIDLLNYALPFAPIRRRFISMPN